MDAKKYVEAIVAKGVAIDLNDTADHVILTVPYGPAGETLNFVPTMLVLRDLSDDAASHTFSAGKSDAKTDFVASITSSGASGTTKILVVRPDFNATPAAGSGLMTIMQSGDTFVIDNLTAAGGACTANVDLFGYFF